LGAFGEDRRRLTGVQILHPRLFADGSDGEFSLNILYDRAQATRRLCGLVHDGDWLHIGTPEILTAAESWFAARVDRVESFGVAVLPGDKGPSDNPIG
jgi:NDP-sugar pyrophosphorylase family protein